MFSKNIFIFIGIGLATASCNIQSEAISNGATVQDGGTTPGDTNNSSNPPSGGKIFGALSAKVLAADQIQLQWQNSSTGKNAHYEIHRYPSGDASHQSYPDRVIAYVTADKTTFSDTAIDNPKAASDASDDVMFDGSGFRQEWDYTYTLVALDDSGAPTGDQASVKIQALLGVVTNPDPIPVPPTPLPVSTGIPKPGQLHDGGGTQQLTNNMITNNATYQHYLIQTGLNLNNVSNVTLTANVISGNGNIRIFNVNGLSISGNTFTSGGIDGTGSTNTIIDSHFDWNTFSNIEEAVHLQFGFSGNSKNVTVSYNHIQGYRRIGIELQYVVHNLKVINNYIVDRLDDGGGVNGKQDGGNMAISCATGAADPIVPGEPDTTGVEIAYNVLVGPAWCIGHDYTDGAIETFGSGSNIHHNYLKDWSSGAGYAYTAVSGNVPWYITDNVMIDVTHLGDWEGYGPHNDPIVLRNSVYGINDPSAPGLPVWPMAGAHP